jgi:nitric oxide reductase subunit B
MMFVTSLLPLGLLQVWYCSSKGFWFARSAEFYELPAVKALAEGRIVSDSILIFLGAVPLLWFLATTFFHLRKPGELPSEEEITRG